MPSWDAYKADATARGALAQEYFMVLSTPGEDLDLVKATLPDHLAYFAEQEAKGNLFLAGPLSDETGTQMQGMGLIIYRAASFEDAQALADGDPMHKSGARSYVLRRWLVNEGSVSLSVGLSGRSIKLS